MGEDGRWEETRREGKGEEKDEERDGGPPRRRW